MKAVAQRGSLPVLSNVLLAVEKGRIRISATDLETGITTWVSAKIEEKGAITVPARILSEFIANLPPGQIMCELDKLTLAIVSENAKSRFNGIDPSEFPSIPSKITKADLKIPSSAFLDAVSEVCFSAATDDSRPTLTGVLINVSKSEATLVGVDGFRLSERKLSLEKEVSEEFSAIISSRVLIEAAKLAAAYDDEISIELNKEGSMVVIKGGDILISSRLIEGEFPDYKKIIPADRSVRAVVNSGDLINAVRLAGVFAQDASNIMRLRISPKNKELLVTSQTSEIGENETRVDILEAQGEDLDVSFNGRYLSELLSNVKADQVSIETSGSLNPALFKIVGRDDYLHIIMPVRVQE